MSPDTQEFGEIFAEIEKEFAEDTVISIEPTAGSPPSQYEVTYRLPSATLTTGGEVAITAEHVITISIPFGFPHFSPSCKPKSSIFHPDFDSSAICLGNFWNRDRSLPELIRYIGTMLSGEEYSTENPFNEEALSWFEANSDLLPFKETEDTSPLQPELTLELDKDDTADELDTLEDDDFFSEVDFEDEFQEEEILFSDEIQALEPEQQEATIPLGMLQNLAAQKNYHQLANELQAIPADELFAERDDIDRQVKQALSRAAEKYDAAEDAENQGDPHTALTLFKEVEALVADFPNIRNDIHRTEQSTAMLGEITDQPDSLSIAPDSPDEDADFPFDSPSDPGERAEEKTRETPAEKKPHFFEEKEKRSTNIIPLVAAGGVLCLVAASGFYYFSLSSKFEEASNLYNDCRSKYTAQQFKAADSSCRKALNSAKGIIIIRQDEVSGLTAGIQTILGAEDMKQGLRGNILHNGQYMPIAQVELYDKLIASRAAGDAAYEALDWPLSVTHYTETLSLAKDSSQLNAEEIDEIKQRIVLAQFTQNYNQAEQYYGSGATADAIALIEKLRTEVEILPGGVQQEYAGKLGILQAKAQFSQLKAQADSHFSQANWESAFKLFQQAIEAGQALSETEQEALSHLQQNKTRAELYGIINTGNIAFASGEWDRAISEYEKARQIITEKSELLQIRDPEKNRREIERIILKSTILHERQRAAKFRQDGDLQGAAASLEEIVSIIERSVFKDDPEFVQIEDETGKVLDQISRELFLSELIEYLKENSAALFISNYPAATEDSLSNPSAEFIRMIDDRYLFKLQTTETGTGRPLKLIMYYTYNPATESWQFHNEPQ